MRQNNGQIIQGSKSVLAEVIDDAIEAGQGKYKGTDGNKIEGSM